VGAAERAAARLAGGSARKLASVAHPVMVMTHPIRQNMTNRT
jgi:hypothetical protein